MGAENAALLLAVAGVVVLPLVREYVDFRAGWGLGRLAALATTLLVVPAVGVGVAVSLPLAAHPAAQWSLTVLVALVAYSAGVRGVQAVRQPARSS